MNNKGFTLVELLATIIILGLVTGISIMSYTSYLNNAKSKTEEVFKNNVSDYIDAFISANTSKLTDDTLAGNNVYTQKDDDHSITFQDIIDDNIINPIEIKRVKDDDKITQEVMKGNGSEIKINEETLRFFDE